MSGRERQPGGRSAADEALERVGGLSLEVIVADEGPVKIRFNLPPEDRGSDIQDYWARA